MSESRDIAERHDIFIIEDAAQALGAKYNGYMAGSMGHVGCFSFYPAKLLGCYGDGGAITTNDEELYKFIKNHRNHCKDDLGEWGINSRLDNLQAAILNLKFKHFENVLKMRWEIEEMYKELDFGDIILPSYRKET